MKRFAILLLVLFFLLPSAVSASVPGTDLPDVSAGAACLYEPSTGTFLYEKNASERLPMASTTKIMTALAALEAVPPDTVIAAAPEACRVEGSGIGLKPGEERTVEELLWALLLESANDAAEALAYGISGGTGAFAALMNEKAAELGLIDTHFVNPHGLDDPEHYTTARDLAILTAAAMENETFRKMVASPRHEIPKTEGTRVLLNHNRLLRERGDVIGVKTGFTKRSGRCLVTAAERDGVTLIAVTLNAPDDWRDHASLYDAAFPRCHAVTLARSGALDVRIPCPTAPGGCVHASNREGLGRIFFGPVPEIAARIETKRLLFPPVRAGEEVGRVVYSSAEGEIGSVPLYAASDIPAPAAPPSLFGKLTEIFRGAEQTG